MAGTDVIDFWTIMAGVLTGISCCLVGCYLVLRKMSLLGDAISHAVLPGIAIGFLLSGKINGPSIIFGAMAMGILTAFLTQSLSRAVRVAEDASLGVVFTSLFAIGVVLVSVKTRGVDLDAGCVLYGLIELIPFETTQLLGVEVPQAVLTLSFMLIVVLVAICLFWKELKLVSFDPELATSLGYPSGLIHYVLMALTAGVTVSAFEAVGSILVVAMLIVPAATAQLLTDRLKTMLLLSSLIATLSAIVGYSGAVYWNTSVAGMMAVAAGLFFFVIMLLAPRYGLMARAIRNLRLSMRIIREDILGTLYRNQEQTGTGLTEAALMMDTASWRRWISIRSLVRRRFITLNKGFFKLTKFGEVKAQQIVRAHRLWETYLQQNVALPVDHLHAPAEIMEHYVGPQLLESLAHELQQPAQDPHGREIPRQ